jgi:hypothetical protein
MKAIAKSKNLLQVDKIMQEHLKNFTCSLKAFRSYQHWYNSALPPAVQTIETNLVNLEYGFYRQYGYYIPATPEYIQWAIANLAIPQRYWAFATARIQEIAAYQAALNETQATIASVDTLIQKLGG